MISSSAGLSYFFWGGHFWYFEVLVPAFVFAAFDAYTCSFAALLIALFFLFMLFLPSLISFAVDRSSLPSPRLLPLPLFAPSSSSSSSSSSSAPASLATTSTNDNNKTYTATTRIRKPRYTYSINSIKTCHKNIWTYHHFTFELISMRCAAAPSPTQFELRTRPTPKKCRKTKQLKENQHLKQYPPGN